MGFDGAAASATDAESRHLPKGSADLLNAEQPPAALLIAKSFQSARGETSSGGFIGRSLSPRHYESQHLNFERVPETGESTASASATDGMPRFSARLPP